jgi:hypothetical protein
MRDRETIVTQDDVFTTMQGGAFEKLARKLECDEDEAAFEDKVRKVATAPKLEAEAEK